LNILTVEVETVSYFKFLQRRKEDYFRDGVEVIVIPLAKLPEDVKGREKELGGGCGGDECRFFYCHI